MNKLVCVLLVSAGTLAAQTPRMFPWWDSPIARDLNLTDDQNKQIIAVLREFRPQMTNLRATLEIAEGDLTDIMNEDAVNTVKANEAIEKVIAARGELTLAVSKMSLRLRLVLTPQQWRELQRRQPQRTWPGPAFRPRGPRPGGPPPGGPGAPPRPEC